MATLTTLEAAIRQAIDILEWEDDETSDEGRIEAALRALKPLWVPPDFGDAFDPFADEEGR